MSKQFLMIKLFKLRETLIQKNEEKSFMIWSEVRDGDLINYDMVSAYSVDLLTLAVGPVRHIIEMNSRGGAFGSLKHQGKLFVDIFFTQLQKVEV